MKSLRALFELPRPGHLDGTIAALSWEHLHLLSLGIRQVSGVPGLLFVESYTLFCEPQELNSLLVPEFCGRVCA